MKILAIETSCDDTGIAILEADKAGNFSVLSNIVASQIEVHKKYGGVFPAMAKREHQNNLVPTLTAAFKKANLLNPRLHTLTPKQNKTLNSILEREPGLEKKLISFLNKYEKPKIDLLAVTNGPGLEPCLWVGVNFARALSYIWNIPIVPVNHIEGHILVNFLNPKPYTLNPNLFPAIALVVSGGHTQIILVEKIGKYIATLKYKILGETRDDAAGECFDKCAKILGLGYPGGPEIAKLTAESGTPLSRTISLPRPMINTKDYDFSFSGLKTAVLYADRKIKNKNKTYKQAMAAEIQQAIIDVLLKKTIKAAKDYSARTIILGGGVSANKELRKQFEKAIRSITSERISLLFPPANLSTDNGLMVATTAYFHRNKKLVKSDLTNLRAEANLRISK